MTIAKNALGTMVAHSEVNSTAIVATANDTTAAVATLPIGNTDGQISFMAAQVVATNQTGTNPTLTLSLQGSADGSTWSTLKNQSASNIATSALDISTASTTTVNAYVDTEQSLRQSFPPFLRWLIAVGGTGTPGGTYTVACTTIRNKFRTALN